MSTGTKNLVTDTSGGHVTTGRKVCTKQIGGAALPASGVNYMAQIAAGAAIDTTGPFTSRSPMRNVKIVLGVGAVATVFTLYGTDVNGRAITETVNCTGAGTFQGKYAMKPTRVTSNVNPGGTTDLQTGDAFCIGEAAASIDTIGLNGTEETPVSVEASSGTVMPTTAPNGTRVYSIAYQVG